jgi:hypothetical protein
MYVAPTSANLDITRIESLSISVNPDLDYTMKNHHLRVIVIIINAFHNLVS